MTPAAMLEAKRWISWRPVPDREHPEKINKVPVDPFTNESFEEGSGWQTDPSRWASFNQMNGHRKGFTLGDGWAGIDLDDCIVEGRVAAWATELVRALGTYAEVSPSGTGIKIFMRGTRPEGAETVKKSAAWNWEIYAEKRYFTVTSNKLPEAPNVIQDCTAPLQKISNIVWGEDLVALCRLRNLILSEGRENVHIRCPWQAEHTHGNGEKDAALQVKDGTVIGFHCFHGHCDKRTIRDIRSWFGVDVDLILSPADPMPSAEAFVTQAYTVGDIRTLQHQSGLFYGYQPEAGAYQQRDEPAVRADLYKFLKPAQQRIAATKATSSQLAPFQPTKSKVENVLDALRAVCNLPTTQMPPCWLAPVYGDLDPRGMLAFTNGLLHVPTRALKLPTPHFFTLNGLDFAYDPRVPEPGRWLAFLDQLWPDDESSIQMLQEMFGYLLTPDTSFQKIFLLHGPKRSGKGIIGRILRRLVGERNACSPTLSSFDKAFGMQGLIGKALAIISDARISRKTDTARVAETLLGISGEDAQTVPRKFLEDWNGMLYTRFVILTNELPHINDASGALASRFQLLTLTQSFYGKEDLVLFNKLVPELPSIALWALEGRDRLYARKHFVAPESTRQLMQEFEDLSSPVSVFLRTHTACEVGTSVAKKLLFAQWGLWCRVHGIEHPGTDATFGRNVRAILPGIEDGRIGGRGQQERCWVGLQMTTMVEVPGGGL